jgi:hypothetical protein
MVMISTKKEKLSCGFGMEGYMQATIYIHDKDIRS